MSMTIYIGADHRGFPLKQALISWLSKAGHQAIDCGNSQLDPGDDYPDFAFAVAEKVAQEHGQSRGIILCGSGVGANVAVNKVVGARGAIGFTSKQVAAGRHDDDMNVLVIAADYISEEMIQRLIMTFIDTAFVPEERYVRRLEKIKQKELA